MKIMQIATFKAVLVRRINIRGCQDCKKILKKIRNAFYKIVKAKSQRASRLNSCESIFVIFLKIFLQPSHPLMLILRAQIALNVAICMIFFNIFLDNGVMNTPKRRILSLVFTVLCFKKHNSNQNVTRCLW